MAKMSTSVPPAVHADFGTVTATEAKNALGAVLERVLVEGGVAITKHDEVKAVLLSVREYEALKAAAPDPLAALTGQFGALVDRMQSARSRDGGRALFEATPAELGEAAVIAATTRD